MKKRLLVIMFFFSCVVYGQQWEWAYPITSYGASPGGNYTYNVMTDSLGNAYFVGSLFSGHNKFEGLNDTFPANDLKSFVVKYDILGNIKWVSGGWGQAYANSNSLKGGFSVDKNGNTYITGTCGTSFFGTGSDTLQITNLQNTGRDFLAKLDSDGRAIFLKVQGDTCSAEGIIITALPTTELIHVGYKLTSCHPMGGTALHYFKKLDASTGNAIWSLIPNGTLIYLGPTHIIPTGDNGFLVAGRYNSDSARFDGLSTHCTLPSSAGANLMFLVKYSSSGEVLWAKKVSDNSNEFNRGVTSDGNNNIIFAVESQGIASYDIATLLPKGNRTLHLIKTDVLGNHLNHLSFNAAGYSHFYMTDLQSDKNGNIYVGAKLDTTLIIGNDTVFDNSNPSNMIYAIIKFDSNLNYLWSQYVSGFTNGHGKFAVTDSIIYFTMNHEAPVSLHGSNYSFPGNNNPNWTSFVAAMKNGNSVTDVITSINKTPMEMVTVFPNPSLGIFNIIFSKLNTVTRICVYDLLGNCIFNKVSTKNNRQEIDLRGQAKGVYFLEIVSDENRAMKKIVLQ